MTLGFGQLILILIAITVSLFNGCTQG